MEANYKKITIIENVETGQFLFLIMLTLSYIQGCPKIGVQTTYYLIEDFSISKASKFSMQD
jgi:hypothetical protein